MCKSCLVLFTVHLHWKVHLSIQSSLVRFCLQNWTIKYLWLVLIAINICTTIHCVHPFGEWKYYFAQSTIHISMVCVWCFFLQRKDYVYYCTSLARQVIHTRMHTLDETSFNGGSCWFSFTPHSFAHFNETPAANSITNRKKRVQWNKQHFICQSI